MVCPSEMIKYSAREAKFLIVKYTRRSKDEEKARQIKPSEVNIKRNDQKSAVEVFLYLFLAVIKFFSPFAFK